MVIAKAKNFLGVILQELLMDFCVHLLVSVINFVQGVILECRARIALRK